MMICLPLTTLDGQRAFLFGIDIYPKQYLAISYKFRFLTYDNKI